MQQVEWNIPVDVWGGLNTKYDPSTKLVSPSEFIAGSVNYDLSPTGNVVKRPKTEVYNPTPLSFPIKDEFEMIFANGTRHKLVMSNGTLYYTTGNGIFNTVQAGYVAAGNMEFAAMNDLVYFGNGIDDPQVYDMGTSYGGVTYTPPTVADAGVIAPTTPVTFAADTAGGAVPAGAHTYKVTFLYRGTQESNGGPVSAVHTVVNPNNTVNLTALPIGGLGVTARKIYRDNNDTNWALVGTVANNTATTFSDTAALGTTPIPEDNNEPPIWALVTQFRDRLWVAGVADAQSTLYYSDAGLPDVWPTNNFIECNSKDVITAVTSFNDKVVVFGKSSFGIILGTTSDNFRYIDISPNIGCVDTRSIQIVTIRGVPKLQWLSQFGVYQWDGSNIQLISDKIENLLRFNIQQAQGSFNKNIQTTQEDFLAGTYTDGIDIGSNPGSINTKGYMKAGDTSTLIDNPTRQWDSQAEWEGGSSLTNIVTQDTTNTIKAVTGFFPTIADETLSNLAVTGTPTNPTASVHTPIVTNNTGESHTGSNVQAGNDNAVVYRIAQPITLARAGTLNSISVRAIAQTPGGVRLMVWADGSGVPGSVLYTGSYQSTGGLTLTTYTDSVSVSLPAGRFWFGLETKATYPQLTTFLQGRTDIYFTQSNTTRPLRSINGGGWNLYNSDVGANPILSLCAGFTFTQTAVAASGSMTSAIYDTLSISASSPRFSQTITNPATTKIVTTVYASNDPTLTTGVVTQVFDSDINPAAFSNTNLSITNKRYWRIISVLNTTDDRVSATGTRSLLDFYGLSTWDSEVIDHTTDILTLDDLLVVSSAPAGTSVTVSIATSANNITYTSFGPIGSATPQRYSKIRAVLVTDINNLVTPTVTSILFNWTVRSVFTSYAITTTLMPVQWGVFQTDSNANGGTMLFEIRSASTEGGLTGASWFTVANGDIIPAPLNIWVQWRVTLTSHVNQVPEVKSTIVNWLVVSSTGIRVASLFYNQVYYLAAAEINSLTNNIVLYYDREGRWGQYTNLTVNTMGLFYGQAYYGDATVGDYVRWLDSSIISDQIILLDIRSKAFSSELISDDKTKALRHAVVEMNDSLASITPLYSIDEGNTWLPMIDVVTGQTTYTGLGTNKKVKIRFVPQSQNIKWGYSIIIRVTNSDQYSLDIAGIRAKAYVSERPVLTR